MSLWVAAVAITALVLTLAQLVLQLTERRKTLREYRSVNARYKLFLDHFLEAHGIVAGPDSNNLKETGPDDSGRAGT